MKTIELDIIEIIAIYATIKCHNEQAMVKDNTTIGVEKKLKNLLDKQHPFDYILTEKPF